MCICKVDKVTNTMSISVGVRMSTVAKLTLYRPHPLLHLHRVTLKVNYTVFFPSCFFVIAGSFAVIWTHGTM